MRRGHKLFIYEAVGPQSGKRMITSGKVKLDERMGTTLGKGCLG